MFLFDCWCFDFDGTLIDLSLKWEKVHKDLIIEFGGKPAEGYIQYRRAGHTELELFLKAGLDEKQIQSYNYKREIMLEDQGYLKNDKLFPQAKKLLKYIRKMNHSCWIITHRSNSKTLENQLTSLGLHEYIRGFICTRDNIKIDEKDLGWSIESQENTAAAKAQILLQLQEKSIVMVGDSPSDILAAKLAGVNSIGIPTGVHSYDELTKVKPNLMFNSLNDLYTQLLSEAS